MARRKKPFIPKSRPGAPAPPGAPGADARAAAAAERTVSINLDAMRAGAGIEKGDRIQIRSGMYAGEFGTVESVVGGVIPAAVIRTDDGRSRRVRAVDLVRSSGPAPERPRSPDDTP
jgi:hypothetical protein